MHPLDGAHEQINGAREHIETLKPEIELFTKDVASEVTLKYRKGQVNIKGRRINAPVGTATFPVNRATPPRAQRLIGETIGSLRKALDYLVYQLACHDSQGVVDNTQFVIADSKKDFKKQLWRLRDLSGEHKDMIERLQPYNGRRWLRILQDLSNPDKHRTLTAVKHTTRIDVAADNTKAILAGRQVDTSDYASIQISFHKGLPVIETLEQLIFDVELLIHMFEPEFQ